MSPVDPHKETVIQGISVSPGIALGPLHLEARGVASPDVYRIKESQVEAERQRYKETVEATSVQLEALQKRVEKLAGGDEGQIFEAHQLILQDKSLNKKVAEEIEKRLQNAESVFYSVAQNYIESMRRVNDSYLRERAADLDDICQRVLRNFSHSLEQVSGPTHKHILIAYDLTPSYTAMMDRGHALGFATEQGSVTSHTAILARSLGIPAIVGLKEGVIDAVALSNCILDGYAGKLILNPERSTVEYYEKRKRELEEQDCKDLVSSRKQKVTQTKDGFKVTLSANIEFSHEVTNVQDSGAEGVGLFRTEFFLLGGGQIPSEEEQFQVYKRVAEGTSPHLAIIRTLDSGGDKLPAEPLDDPEPNPFLGWRGIRVSLSRVEMFKDQLRAILRASAFGKLGLMFPLVSGMSEVMRAKEILAECMSELEEAGVDFDRDVQIGIMIEVPSAALITPELAEVVDFFSIGTNDLIQYAVAVDRVNPQVSHLYKPCNPGVIRLIKMTIDAGKSKGIWTGICGEMAGLFDVLPLLIGLGVDELSVGTHQLPKIKKAIGRLSKTECEEMAAEALKCSFAREIRALSRAVAKQSFPDLIGE